MIRTIQKDGQILDMEEGNEELQKTIWHTTSHILAQAVKRLYPNTKLGIGPAIENGFYYDFRVEKPFSEEDIAKIEEEMKKIVKEDLPLERSVLSREEAIKLMEEKEEPYKVQLIKELPEGETISFFKQGEFIDLCAGPHINRTGKIKAIKLLTTSAAYWKGNQENDSMQRIYGVSFLKASQLEEHLRLLEEAKQRDHRKIGKELELFMTHELVGSGLPMYLPNGATIRRILERYIQDKEIDLGYSHVYTPSLANVQLYKTSGHWDHYKDDMFPAMKLDNEEMVLRPMNCPHHMLVYKSKQRSYKDLPIKIGELANDFRYEAAGAVKGIERARSFTQNDSHIFCTPEQIEEEFKGVLDLIIEVYKDFNIDITKHKFRLSLRDKNDKEKYFDDDEMWNRAEDALRKVLTDLKVDFIEAEGEAAFYGPKLDILIKPAVGNEVAIPTIQLDFLLPRRFNLTYINEQGEKVTPVVIHRAILGSLDRFIAFLLEETKGNLPLWLAPVGVEVIPVSSEHHLEYAKNVYQELLKNGIRVELDDRNEKLGYRLREAQTRKINYTLILGDNEKLDRTVSYRLHGEKETTTVSLDEFIKLLNDEIANKR